MLALMEAAAQHFTRTLLGGAGHEGARVPARARLREGRRSSGSAPARRATPGTTCSTRSARRFPPALAGQGRPGRRAPGQGGPLRPLPQPRRLPDPERVRAGGGVRRALARRQRAQVPELPRDARLLEEPRPLRPLVGARDDPREKRAVLMEGYLDVARAIEHGVTEAVATCGTALTAQHARLLRRFAETVVAQLRPGRGRAEGGAQEPRDPARGGAAGADRRAARGARSRHVSQGRGGRELP